MRQGYTQRETRRDILFIHWNEAEARELAAPLASDWNMQVVHWGDMIPMKDLRENPPKAIVISLRRLPSHGKHTAEVFQQTKWSREIPLVFFDGAEEKVFTLMAAFPTARFITYENLRSVLSSL